MQEIKFSIYRYNPKDNIKPKMQDYILSIEKNSDMMLLDALVLLKKQDETLSFRRSCGEGVCGSDGMNINGKNGLACITSLSELTKKSKKIVLRPLPGLPVIRDLIVDMTRFYKQYEKAEPYLQNSDPEPVRERLQTPDEVAKLEGLYECILCACCSTSCPSFWWNPDKFMGPAALLQAWRFVVDSRDNQEQKRLSKLKDAYSVYRCRSIMNCVDACPKNLNPTKAIDNLREKLVENECG